MMTSSDERIEIAERMRGPFDVCECVGHTFINGNIFGLQVCAKDEIDLRNGMRHLAELIDPTCKVSSVETYCNELGQLDGWEFHLTCGHSVKRPYYEAPSYCPDCGARVVNR